MINQEHTIKSTKVFVDKIFTTAITLVFSVPKIFLPENYFILSKDFSVQKPSLDDLQTLQNEH